MKVGDSLYRLADASPMYECAPTFDLQEWKVTRLTRCCAYLQLLYGLGWANGLSTKRMAIEAKRPFAHPTKEEAAQAYARRKFRHIEHLRRRLTEARARFSAVKDKFGIEMEEPDDEWFTL